MYNDYFRAAYLSEISVEDFSVIFFLANRLSSIACYKRLTKLAGIHCVMGLDIDLGFQGQSDIYTYAIYFWAR